MADVPGEYRDDARDRYRTDIERWRSLLRLRLTLVVLCGVWRVTRVAFVVSSEPGLDIASVVGMPLQMVVVTPETVVMFGRKRLGCRPMRVLVKSKVQGQEQRLH